MTSGIVLDCSVTGAWFLRDEIQSPQANRILERLINGQISASVPKLWHYEMLNLLRTATHRKRITDQEAFQVLQMIQSLPLQTIDLLPTHSASILTISIENGLTAYDASYLICAQMLGMDLVTYDSDLLKLKKKHRWIKEPIDA